MTEFGFSEKLGPIRYSDNEEEVFLGHSVTQRKNVSDATAQIIDEEVRRLIETAEETATMPALMAPNVATSRHDAERSDEPERTDLVGVFARDLDAPLAARSVAES